MREICFKLFDLPTHQVLVKRERDNSGYLLTNSVFLKEPFFEGMVNSSMVFSDQYERDNLFNNYREKDAERFLKKLLAQFEEREALSDSVLLKALEDYQVTEKLLPQFEQSESFQRVHPKEEIESFGILIQTLNEKHNINLPLIPIIELYEEFTIARNDYYQPFSFIEKGHTEEFIDFLKDKITKQLIGLNLRVSLNNFGY